MDWILEVDLCVHRREAMFAMVVNLNLGKRDGRRSSRTSKGRLKVGIQLFDPNAPQFFDYPWKGF